MSALDLRGRVVITNGASGTLNAIRRDLNAIGAQSRRTSVGGFTANAFNSMVLATDRLQRSITGLRSTLMGAGFALAGIIATTRNFNESNYGYGFARITDYIKDGKLQLDAWKSAMEAAGKEARESAKSFGSTPEITMKAKEEVEKLGYSGSESKALYGAAMGLHLAGPRELEAGEAAKFVGQVYAGFAKHREAQAAKMGKDVNDPAFQEQYMKDVAARAAYAASASPLAPVDVVQGMRQYAPMYAAMGIPYEFALAMLAHSSKHGFGASELGTAFKSMGNKALNPTATALRVLDARGINRSDYMKTEAADPQRAVQRLNNLLDGQLFQGKGGKQRRAALVKEMREAKESGQLTSAEYQQHLTGRILKTLGKGWEGRADDVRQAVANSVSQASGEIDLPAYIGALRNAGVTIGELAQIFEGRHVARNTPLFEFYEDLIKTYEAIQAVDGSVIDAVVEGRKNTEAGKTDSVIGAWQNLMSAIEDTGVITRAKDALIELMDAIARLPSGVLGGLAAAVVGLGGAAAAFGVAAVGMKALRAIGGVAGLGAGAVAGAKGQRGSARAKAGGDPGRRMGNIGAESRAAEDARRARMERDNERLRKGLGGGTPAKQPWWGRLKGLGGKALHAVPGLGTAAFLATLAYEIYGGSHAQAGEQGDRESGIDLPAIDVDQGMGLDGSAVADAQSIADQIQQVFASIDLHAAGQQMMASLAAGITAGGAQAVAAANNVASQVRAAGQRVQLNTGPNMMPAR